MTFRSRTYKTGHSLLELRLYTMEILWGNQLGEVAEAARIEIEKVAGPTDLDNISLSANRAGMHFAINLPIQYATAAEAAGFKACKGN